ncbi:MAG: hypothetical protein K1X74_00400 [Pirellulales bacterium]|nr:hypothetical protein [Pirellulales bacterium]
MLLPYWPSLHVRWRLLPHMLVTMAYATGVQLVFSLTHMPAWNAGERFGGLLGVVLGVLLVLRVNAANERWWEARKQWGQLINDSRNLALKALAHANPDAADRARLACLLREFAFALRDHLRGIEPLVTPSLATRFSTSHVPGRIAGEIHELLDRWNQAGKLKDSLWPLDVHARSLMDICGACERIRNTPLASSYRALLRWAIVLNVLVAPWVIADDIGWWSVPVLTVGFAFLLGVELTAEDVEEPFGDDPDDLPLESYCCTIERFVNETLARPSSTT